MHRVVVVFIAFEATGVLRRILEIVLDAVDLIAEPMRFTQKFWGIRGDTFEHFLIDLDKWHRLPRVWRPRRCSRFRLRQWRHLCADWQEVAHRPALVLENTKTLSLSLHRLPDFDAKRRREIRACTHKSRLGRLDQYPVCDALRTQAGRQVESESCHPRTLGCQYSARFLPGAFELRGQPGTGRRLGQTALVPAGRTSLASERAFWSASHLASSRPLSAGNLSSRNAEDWIRSTRKWR